MRTKHFLSLALSGVLCFSMILVPSVRSIAAAAPIRRSITISVANDKDGSINPAAVFDTGAAPFTTDGPLTVTGYYKYTQIAPLGDGAFANLFGLRVSDTKNKWQSFTASFEPSTGLNGMHLWYMAGDISIGDIVITNARGEEVYNMADDNQLTAGSVTSLTQKGMWYLWNYDTKPGNRFTTTVAVNDIAQGLVPGSIYAVDSENQVSGVPLGTTVFDLKSNFSNNKYITIHDKVGKVLNDEEPVICGAQVIYNEGTSNEIAYVVDALTGDPNGDGKIDVRDLRLVKENVFGDGDVMKNAADINQDNVVGLADVDIYREMIFGKTPQTSQSVGADVLLANCNPIGRIYKRNSALYLEHSASNFTVTGHFSGDISLNLFVDDNAAISDPVGLYVEIDGKMSYHRINSYYENIEVTIAKNLSDGKHVIKVSKATDAACDKLYINSMTYTGTLTKSVPAKHRVEFLGDSITAGVGMFNNMTDTSNYNKYGLSASYFSYANMTADTLEADYYSVAIGGWQLCATLNPQIAIPSIYPYRSIQEMTNEGLYDFTWQPEVVVINLGTNDWNNPEDAIRLNAQKLLDMVREKNPNATIVWAYGMMDADHANVTWIKEEVQKFAENDHNAYFVHLPENTKGWAAHPDLNGQKAAAKVLVQEIQRIMGW